MRGESTDNVQEPPKSNSQKDGIENAMSKSSSDNISSNEGRHDNESPVVTAINNEAETQPISKSWSEGQGNGSPVATAINDKAETQAISKSWSKAHDDGSPVSTAINDEAER